MKSSSLTVNENPEQLPLIGSCDIISTSIPDFAIIANTSAMWATSAGASQSEKSVTSSVT